jgi:hypothetical protein
MTTSWLSLRVHCDGVVARYLLWFGADFVELLHIELLHIGRLNCRILAGTTDRAPTLHSLRRPVDKPTP